MARLEIRLLGGFEVACGSVPVADFESNTSRALLAYIACEPGRHVSRPTLAEMLWPDRAPGAALGNLRHSLSTLRRTLGQCTHAHGLLEVDRHTVSIADSSGLWVDVVEFQRLAELGGGDRATVEAWERAVELWRGPFLDGFVTRAGAEWDEWVVVTGERLRTQLVSVLRLLSDHHHHTGEFERAIVAARQLTEVNPWDERDHRRLLRLLVATGDRAGAVAHFEHLVERLDHELHLKPSSATRALSERIRAG